MTSLGVVKTPGGANSTATGAANTTVAPHLTLSTDEAVPGEPVDGVVDEIAHIVVTDVGVPVVVGSGTKGAGAVLGDLALTTGGGDPPGAIASNVADEDLAVGDLGGPTAGAVDEGGIITVVDATGLEFASDVVVGVGAGWGGRDPGDALVVGLDVDRCGNGGADEGSEENGKHGSLHLGCKRKSAKLRDQMN
jgi:hypothetical protein